MYVRVCRMEPQHEEPSARRGRDSPRGRPGDPGGGARRSGVNNGGVCCLLDVEPVLGFCRTQFGSEPPNRTTETSGTKQVRSGFCRRAGLTGGTRRGPRGPPGGQRRDFTSSCVELFFSFFHCWSRPIETSSDRVQNRSFKRRP